MVIGMTEEVKEVEMKKEMKKEMKELEMKD